MMVLDRGTRKKERAKETKKILIVEDDDASAGDYRQWLEHEGHDVRRAAAAEDGVAEADRFEPHVILLDMQIPSAPGRSDEHVAHGLDTLEELVAQDRFRPIVVVTAHSRDRELMRAALQRTRGGQFVFKDADDLRAELLAAVHVALASPAYLLSRAVGEFRRMLDEERPEDDYRRFIAEHWQVFLGPEYRDCESPYTVMRGGAVDLMAVRHDGFPDFWELKLPGDPLFVEYNQWYHHSSKCAQALGQLAEYIRGAEVETPPGAGGYERRRGLDVKLHGPRGFVVIGRSRGERERERLRLENRFLSGLTIFTYDDLVDRALRFVEFLHVARNGHGL